MCRINDGKIRYATFELAQMDLYRIKSIKQKNKRVPQRAFYCHECDGYHLTSQTKDWRAEQNEVV